MDIFLQDYKRTIEDQLLLLAKDKKDKAKPKVDLKPLFIIEDDKNKTEMMSLIDILQYVRESAKKGMDTQRYKGLGEMNPQQLWDTTMDPERRTILKVTLEDAVEVDKTFAMLMGDEVEPRRKFIESYAHEVKNLDI
jgi:DNA gyrase subunit B